jgi:hypothetical protein
VGSSCEVGNEPSGSIKCWECTEWLHNLWPLEWYSGLIVRSEAVTLLNRTLQDLRMQVRLQHTFGIVDSALLYLPSTSSASAAHWMLFFAG